MAQRSPRPELRLPTPRDGFPEHARNGDPRGHGHRRWRVHCQGNQRLRGHRGQMSDQGQQTHGSPSKVSYEGISDFCQGYLQNYFLK